MRKKMEEEILPKLATKSCRKAMKNSKMIAK